MRWQHNDGKDYSQANIEVASLDTNGFVLSSNRDAIGQAATAKVKTSKLKGNYMCWASYQEPKDYMDVRLNPDRASDELTLPELKNAVCYVLQEKGSMEKDDLIKEASRVLGYKRLGKNLEGLLTEGLQYARSNKEITVEKGICDLYKE